MMENFQTIAGAYPYVRVGGSTQNRNWYYENQTEALIETFTNPWDDQPSAVSTGPSWFESFQQLPSGTKYIYGLNFYDNESGLEQTVAQATPAYLALGDALYAYEIGNEPNGKLLVHANMDIIDIILQAGQGPQDGRRTGPSRTTSPSGRSMRRP